MDGRGKMERPVQEGFDLRKAYLAMQITRTYVQGQGSYVDGQLGISGQWYEVAEEAMAYAEARWSTATRGSPRYAWAEGNREALAELRDLTLAGIGVAREALDRRAQAQLTVLLLAALEYAAEIHQRPEMAEVEQGLAREAQRLREAGGGLDEEEIIQLLIATAPREIEEIRRMEAKALQGAGA